MKSECTLFAGAFGLLLSIIDSIEWSFHASNGSGGLIAIVAGFVLMAISLIQNRKELLEKLKRRAFVYDTNNLVYTVAVGLILIILNSFAINYSEHVFFLPKYDLTRNSFYTLSPQSLKAVKSLKEDVECLVFYISPRGSGPAARMIARETEQMRTLLKLYRGANRHFSYRIIDPEKEPALAEQYKVTIPGSVILRKKDREIPINRWAIFRPADPVKKRQGCIHR